MCYTSCMTNGLSLPPAVSACLAQFDDNSQSFREINVFGAIQSALEGVEGLSAEEKAACYAEITAFNLMASHNSPWGTHFGPMMTGEKADGTPFYSPDIASTAKGTNQYWQERAAAVVNPILKARYADVAWDMAVQMGERRNPEMARMAVDAYLAAVDVHDNLHDKLKAVGRALELAIMLGDEGSIETTRKRLLALHREAVEAKKMWWFAWDCLFDNKKAGLTAAERQTLVDDMESLLAHFGDHSPGSFNPHDVQSIANRLIKVYAREGRKDDVKRLHAAVGKAFEHFGAMGDGLLGSLVLDTAVSSYRAAGMEAEARKARLLHEEKVAQASNEMVPISTTIEIPKEKMDEYLAIVVVDDAGQTLANIAMDHLAKREELEELMAHAAEHAPLMATIGRSILTDTHVAAKVGSMDDDPAGRILQQALQNFQFSNIWLNRALITAIERHRLTPEGIAAFANRADLYDDVALLLEGLKAWFAKDYVKAIHVLVPQVEHGLRQIVSKMGKPVTKPHKPVPGTSVAINMGDILFDKDVAETLGPNLTLHLQALYTDPRGWNIRNELAHGLLRAKEMNEGMAQWVVHSLLLLGLKNEISAMGKPTGKESLQVQAAEESSAVGNHPEIPDS